MKKYLDNLTTDDFKIFEAIELQRQKVISEDRSIEVIDYGAGNPNDNRTVKQMSDGIIKEISTKNLCKIGLKNDYAHLIYAIVQKHQPKTVLELGTCCGFSSIYISKALNNQNTIHTIEGSPQTVQIAQKNFIETKCTNINSHVGKFSDVLPELLPKIEPIDFAFIDGHHDKDATLKYFEDLKPYLSQNALILFDDISWSDGMKEAWKIIKKDKSIECYKDFDKVGLCFMKGK